MEADEGLSPGLFVALPLVLGMTGGENSSGVGVAWGVRPEIALAWTRRTRVATQARRGRAVGAYGEIVRLDGVVSPGLVTGFGVSYVEYLGGLALAPSVGVHWLPAENGRQRGASLGFFIGRRGATGDRFLDLPYGIRFDVHADPGEPGEALFVASLSGDLIGLVGGAILGIWVMAAGGA